MAFVAFVEMALAKLGCSRIARTPNYVRHPEVLDQRSSLEGDGPSAAAVVLRGSLSLAPQDDGSQRGRHHAQQHT